MTERSSTRFSLNPITKMALLVALSITVLSLSSEVYVLSFLAAALIAERVFRAPGRTKAVVRGATAFAIAIFVAQVIFNHSGEEIARIWILSVTSGGIEWGIIIAGKFLTLITMSKTLVSTTKASELSAALTSAGVSNKASFMPALAIRFVPVFQLELATVREAQVTRGLRLDRSVRGLIRSARYTTLPMLYVALSKVNTLASSMVGRGFGAFHTRTLLRGRNMTGWDWAIVAAVTLLAITVFVLNTQMPLKLPGYL